MLARRRGPFLGWMVIRTAHLTYTSLVLYFFVLCSVTLAGFISAMISRSLSTSLLSLSSITSTLLGFLLISLPVLSLAVMRDLLTMVTKPLVE